MHLLGGPHLCLGGLRHWVTVLIHSGKDPDGRDPSVQGLLRVPFHPLCRS